MKNNYEEVIEMPYEIEFIGVNKETQDATAICMRWKKADDSYCVGVFDGGFAAHGEELTAHLNKYYFPDKTEVEDKIVDFVICSHPHQDHASGLAEILKNFKVQSFYMNRPWDYVDELYKKVNDGRITMSSLEVRLKQKYSYIASLEEIAIEKDIPIYSVLEGTEINDKLTVLSPDKDFYLELLVESDKTPLETKDSLYEMVVNAAKKIIDKLKESWSDEKLREDVSTEPDNETSTIVLGEMDEEAFLLTGDVGIRGLQKAIDYANRIGKPIKDTVSIYEIPHHGGRHNISPSILNQLLGNIVDENCETDKQSYVCTGKNSDHPLQMVVNAFKRRGSKVYNASGSTICHHRGDMPKREGWSSVSDLEFKTEVEEWD